MADPKYVQPSGGINLVDLAGLLGGQTSTTTRNADTSALQGVLGQLQSQDPNALLQSIFTQAAGQMPGLQSRFSNAVGARSGGNSGVQTALSRLLQQTTLLGQQQVAAQQAQNLSTQANVAGQIAQATGSQTTKQGTNLGQAGKNLALISAGNKVLNSDLVKSGVGKAKNLFDDLFSGRGDSSGGNLTSALGSQDFMGPLQELTSVAPALNSFDFGGTIDAGAGISDFLSSIGAGSGEAAADLFSNPDFDWTFGLKHGGMVGRDTPSDRKNYADGGQVNIRSGGGRRSSAPSYTPNQINPASAIQGGNLFRALGLTGSGLAGGVNADGQNAADNQTAANTSLSLGQIGANALGLMGNPMGFMAHTMDQAMTQQNPQAVSMFGPVANAIAAVTTANPIAAVNAILGLMAAVGKGSGQSDDEGFASAPMGAMSAPGLGAMGLSASTAAALGLSPADNFGPMSTTEAFSQSMSPAATAISDALSAGNDGGYSGFGSEGFGGAESGVSGGFGAGDSGASGGDASAGFGGDASGEGSASAKNGGKIVGPGTGTSDSINVNVSNGEYVVPADVVKQLGVGFFDSLRDHFHDFSETQPSYKKK